jgi:hypothetical protein
MDRFYVLAAAKRRQQIVGYVFMSGRRYWPIGSSCAKFYGSVLSIMPPPGMSGSDELVPAAMM